MIFSFFSFNIFASAEIIGGDECELTSENTDGVIKQAVMGVCVTGGDSVTIKGVPTGIPVQYTRMYVAPEAGGNPYSVWLRTNQNGIIIFDNDNKVNTTVVLVDEIDFGFTFVDRSNVVGADENNVGFGPAGTCIGKVGRFECNPQNQFFDAEDFVRKMAIIPNEGLVTLLYFQNELMRADLVGYMQMPQ